MKNVLIWLSIVVVIIVIVNLFNRSDAHAADGEKIFERKCSACHDFKPKNRRLGPHLVGLVTADGLSGRRIGSVETYKYSKAMQEWYKEGWKWDEVSLAIWLQNPRKMIPGTRMIFAGIKKQDEMDSLIEYLKGK